MAGLTLTFDPSVTTQQEQWFRAALAHSTFAWDQSALRVNVKTVDEPSCAGHKDYMCTSLTDGVATIEIRQGADDPTAAFNQGLPSPTRTVPIFFGESVLHEMGHAFFMSHFGEAGDQLNLSGFFDRSDATGGGLRQGNENDWNPLDAAWGDRIQEALAEFFKDVYMPSRYRVFDNRSNWRFDGTRFNEWVGLIESVICPPSDPVTTLIASRGGIASGYPMNLVDRTGVIEGIPLGPGVPPTGVGQAASPAGAYYGPDADAPPYIGDYKYGGGFAEASGSFVGHPGDFNTPVNVGESIGITWDFIGDGLDAAPTDSWDYYESDIVPTYSRAWDHYPVQWKLTALNPDNPSSGQVLSVGYAPFPEGPAPVDIPLHRDAAPIGGIFYYVRYRSFADSPEGWTYLACGDGRNPDQAKGSASIQMTERLEVEWRVMLPNDSSALQSGTPDFNDPGARGSRTAITARPKPVSCPMRPPWPYPSPVVKASAGPIGVMRGARP